MRPLRGGQGTFDRGPGNKDRQRDKLDGRLPFCELGDVDLNVELGQELAKAGYQYFARQYDDRRPDRPAADRASVHQHQQGDADEQLIGYGIEHAPKRRLLLPHPGEIAVQPIGDAGKDEQREGRPTRYVTLQEEEAGNERRHRCNTNVRQHVRQTHGHGARSGGVFHPPLVHHPPDGSSMAQIG